MFPTLLAALLIACGGGDTTGKTGKAKAKGKKAEKVEQFSLAWSEYPSWSVFGVAHELKLINGKAGKMGEIEEKYGIDIVLKEADYDACIQMYGSGQVDAAALTNMDALALSESRATTAILPTSTSDGADALLVTNDITDITQLKGKNVYGLAGTVSEYTFVRNLQLLGQTEKDYKFTNMDPAAAATAMQQKQKGYEAIVVWNPFVMETLSKRKDVGVLFDSTAIPGEIIDMVVMGSDSLDKPGGKKFAQAVIHTFYAVSDRIEDPATRKDTLVALGEKFSHLKAKQMETVVEQTKFYKGPAAAKKLFTGPKLKKAMEEVVKFELAHEMIKKEPKIGYDDKAKAAFRFDTSFLQKVADANPKLGKDMKAKAKGKGKDAKGKGKGDKAGKSGGAKAAKGGGGKAGKGKGKGKKAE